MSLFLFIILICLREPKIVCYLGTFKNKLPLIISAFIVTHSYIMNSSEVKVPKVTGKLEKVALLQAKVLNFY